MKGKQLVLDIIKHGPMIFFETLFGTKTHILFLGLDNAGKTTLLLKLKTDTVHTVAPTLSVREEFLQIGNMKVTISDLGGHAAARLGWDTYFVQSQGIVFMIDITDEKRYDLVRKTYNQVLRTMDEADRRNIPVAVLFNKTDAWVKYWEMNHPGTPVPQLNPPYLKYLCQTLGVFPSEGEAGRQISANFCSVVKDTITDHDKGFMVAFKWLDAMIKANK